VEQLNNLRIKMKKEGSFYSLASPMDKENNADQVNTEDSDDADSGTKDEIDAMTTIESEEEQSEEEQSEKEKSEEKKSGKEKSEDDEELEENFYEDKYACDKSAGINSATIIESSQQPIKSRFRH
jgi:hypothetical protein